MSPSEIATLFGLLASAGLSTVVCLGFRGSMDRMLNDIVSRAERTPFTEGRVNFWVIYSYFLVIFLPAIGVLLRASTSNSATILSMFFDQLLWCLIGMVVALFLHGLRYRHVYQLDLADNQSESRPGR